MHKWGYRGLMLVLAACCLLGLTPPKAVAQAPPDKPLMGIGLSPYLQEITLNPADTSKAFEIRLANTAQYAQDLNVLVVNFGAQDENGGLLFAGSNPDKLIAKYGLADWVELEQTAVSLKAGGTTTLKGRVNNRDSLTPGGHYAAVLVSARLPMDTSKQINFKQTLASLLFAKKLGGERYDLHLERMEAHHSWFGKPPSTVRLRFYNPGNVFVVPRGRVRLLGPDNKVLRQGIINPDSSYVLPETYRQTAVPLQVVAAERFWLLRTYRLSVDYRYDGMDQFANKTVTMRVLNVPLAIGGLVVLAGLAIAVVMYLRRRHKKQPKKAPREKKISVKHIA